MMLEKLFHPTYLKRFLFFFLSDIFIVIFSLYLSFLLRFEFSLTDEFKRMFLHALPLFLLIKLPVFAQFRIYRFTWKYVGIKDLYNIVKAVIIAEAVLVFLLIVFLPAPLFKFIPPLKGFPRSIFLIDMTLSIILLSGLRISKRAFLEIFLKEIHKKDGLRAAVIGAGNTGEMILRDMTKQGKSTFNPVALIDDNPLKLGNYLHGVKVLGSIDSFRRIVMKNQIEAVIIAIPSLNYKVLRNIYDMAKASNIRTIKIVPRIYDFQNPNINLKALEEIRIEDLIGRQTVSVNYEEIGRSLKRRNVFITGAGGSIGSELVKQVCAFYPERVTLFDIDETSLHSMEMQLKRLFPGLSDRLDFIVGDIRDRDTVDEVFGKCKPYMVFHAAAYKHVPMMEFNPKEAIKANIFGTYTVAEAAVKHNVTKFVMISTDKAVKPSSVMGATKRMSEYICNAFNSCNGSEFLSVRFGNVLGSRGSVLPLFMEQLKQGGPLTVTHEEMQRYFMTIPEAVSLVLQASVIGECGEVLVLDMGEPVKIVKLAEEIIRLHGMEPNRDIDIEFMGVRPGEKLFEETLTAEEGTVATKHEKIYIAKDSVKYTLAEIRDIIKEFEILLKKQTEDGSEIKLLLKKYIKHYEQKD